MTIALVAFFVNTFFMCLSFWMAFSPRFRPMTWRAFNVNIGAAGINLFAVIIHTYNLVTA